MSAKPLYFAGLLCILLFGFSSAAPAQDGCGSCGSRPGFPDAASFLDAHGYPASDYSVLISWQEAAPRDPGTLVTGYHVRPRRGGPAFDLYSDASGSLLNSAQVALLGIRAKRWDLPPVEKAAEVPAPLVKVLPPRPRPAGAANAIAVSAGVALPEIDLGQVLFEDEQRNAEQGKGATRIGVFQDLDQAVRVDGSTTSDGYWTPMPGGGSLWSVALYSPEALAMRVHFSLISLPEGASVVVYNAATPSEAYGPYQGPDAGSSGLWSATCFSDTVVVECDVPAGVSVDAVRLSIDRVVHNYVAFGDLAWAKTAGTCNNDVTCFPAWASASTGVAGVGSIGGNGSFFCTGSLLADTDTTTDVPYFLTANHCVGTSSEAASLEVYWLYQTSTCNGVPPDPATVPRTTGGAALLATADASSGTDFCLLRLNNDPPAGLTHLGWSNVPTSLGTTTACIHHPSADYKRLSFGILSDVAEALRGIRPASRFYQSSWTSGTTEPGSSGSPLFVESTQQVIGQLWGGPGACTSSTNLDYFGRFDVGYPLMAAWLDPQPVAGQLQVVQPNGGEDWTLGDTHTIQWTSSGTVGADVRVELWRNGAMDLLVNGSTPNNGQVRWTIPSSLTPGTGYAVRIQSVTDPNIFDFSNSTFTLSSAPPAPTPTPSPGGWYPFRFLISLLRLILSLFGIGAPG